MTLEMILQHRVFSRMLQVKIKGGEEVVVANSLQTSFNRRTLGRT